MGFYGNITNTARTQFQFDIVYPNKTEMVKNQTTDGVYVGRYVLVEYDTETNVHNFDRVYIYNNKLYTSANHESGTLITKSVYNKGEIVYTAEDTVMSTGYPLSKCTFYVITSDKISSTSPATYEEIVSSGTKTNYTYNYNIDMAKGEEGRGYDSTVWQKTYINGSEKYVMIAELNSVVPTFNIVADPPMMAPITPHFDIESTDIYYKLHWQTPWGFRVAEANGTNVTSTTNNKAQLPSDTTATYTINKYNEDSGVNESKTSDEYKAAIYYNAAGFDPKTRTRSTYKDDISIKPTGQSGNKYNLHTGGSGNMGVQPDIMEFSFILPSLGNAISDIWDIVYDEGRHRDVKWKDALAPEADTTIGGMTRELTTLAGCINYVHDLMGMIITDKSKATLNEEWYNKKYLYQDGDKYYRIAAEQTYTYPNDATVGTKSDIEYKFVEVPDVAGKLSTIYGCMLQMRELMGTELDADTKDRNTVLGSINVLNDLIDLFESKIYPTRPVITNSNGQLCTADWTTAQIGEAVNQGTGNTINFETKENQWISYSVDGDNKQISIYHTTHSVDDTTTTKNANGNGDTITTYAPIVDSMGHIVGKNTETITLPYGYKNITVSGSSTIVSDVAHSGKTLTATNTQDTITFKPSNKWIKMQADNKTVSISHEVHSFSDGEANREYGLTANKSITELDKNNIFEVPVFKFDEAGHITGARTHTIAIPENFDTVAITNDGKASIAVNATAQDGNLEADTLTDTITFDAGNRWITMVANESADKVSIYHAAAGNQANTTQTGDEEPDFGATFKIPEVKYDEAGHISAVGTHAVKVPLPSLNDFTASSASVITGMSMNASEGAITITHDDIGNRLLTGYDIGTNSKQIANTDKVNEAFGKVQVQLNNEITARTNAVSSEQSRAESKEKELEDAIVAEAKTARAAEKTLTDNLATEVSNRTTAVTAEQERAEGVESTLEAAINQEIADRKAAIDQEVTDRNTAISDAINELDVASIGEEGKYISAIAQIDGKITATLSDLPNYTDNWNRITTLEGDLESANETIDNLTTEVETLKSLIESLTERITKLEPTEEQPTDPTPEEDLTE